MSTKTRIAFAAIAAVLAVTAIVLAQPDEASEQADDPSPGAAQPAPGTDPTATAPSAPEPAPMEIVLRDHRVEGGVQTIKVKTGDTIRFLVSSNAADEIHFHGYDIEQKVRPGAPARFEAKADLEGIFEVESHEAEHAGNESLIAKVVVEPS